ncbi:ataxin-3 isoform X2 [Hemibagrus wyckioides]|uniref:ataxin-3 isoform X2 n=1 Tax=Hemibagrus wyckioides TaxID=337641 RepID=UPI00266CFBB1|nr:ataxin-3 isoform X2 [Hemibagrus wyckioides]
MESIFHEKQEGSLCAQHCLNNLLQGEYFTPVDLSSIAQQLDEEERMRMAEGGLLSEEYRTFLQQPSGNMDDSGFFSIQVISNALSVWGLELILFNSREYQQLMIDPMTTVQHGVETQHGMEQGVVDEDDEELRKALALSRQDIEVEDEEADLRRAIQLSMLGASGSSNPIVPKEGSAAVAPSSTESTTGGQTESLTAEELRRRRQAYFDRQSQQQAQATSPHQQDTKASGEEQITGSKHSQ